MSCQSTPGSEEHISYTKGLQAGHQGLRVSSHWVGGGPMRCPWYLFHRLF
ncbi:unnamed protein product [Staurois parvus]|uniref:Uncharacterized protein n=1 Tax=Staurois parvus TaxID=386267 RepID=A0ABN9AI77_9NEOB|nr:unnamed protein product [Staurois parvus]